MSDASKKRKAGTDEMETSNVVTVTSAWEALKGSGPAAYESLRAYLKAAYENKEDSTEIMGAVYLRAANMENRFVCPAEFRTLTTSRDKEGKITAIQDESSNRITGRSLQKALAYAAMRDKGYKAVIFGEVTDHAVEILAIPSGVQVDTSSIQSEKSFHKDVRTLFTHKAGTTVYVPTGILEAILELDYVTIGEVLNLTKSLNALAKKEDMKDFDTERLVNLADLHALLQDADTKQSRKQFLQTLLAAKIARLTAEERLSYFKAHPSYTLANNLELKLPHGGPCYLRPGNVEASKVPLGSVGPDDSVLLATNILSQKEYSEIVGDISDYPVYVNSEQLGGRKKSKWASMSVKPVMKAGLLHELLTAISASNAPAGSTSTAVATVPVPTSTDVLDVELD